MANQALLNRVLDSPQIPSPPAVALQVCDRASRPDCPLEEVGELVKMDPGMSGRILKTVNSALYGLPRVVTSIDRAISILGTKSLRALVLSLSLPALQFRAAAHARLREFWRSSVAGAIVARELSVRLKRRDPEDDLIAALLRDLGGLVLQHVFPTEYATILTSPPDVLALSQCWLEEKTLGINHAEVSAHLLKRWGLPPEIVEPVRNHHQPGLALATDGAITERTHLLHFATRVVQLQYASCRHAVGKEVIEIAQKRYGLDERQLAEFLEPLTQKIEQFASLLSVDIGRCPDYADVLNRAIDELVQLTLETSLDESLPEEQRQEAAREVERWRRAANRLRRQAQRDPVTHAYHRGFFEGLVAAEYRRSRRRTRPLGLIGLGLHGLGRLQDERGALFADQAVKEFATRLRREARRCEQVGRTGLDQFCVLVPDAAEDDLRHRASALLSALTPFAVRQGDDAQPIGCSAVAVLALPKPEGPAPAQILDATDRAVCAAQKLESGEVRFLSLLSEADATLEEQVRQRLFSTWLLAGRRVDEGRLQEAARAVVPMGHGFGRWCRQHGWLRPRALWKVFAERRRTHAGVVDVALRQARLGEMQRLALLALRREPPEALAQALVEAGAWSEADAAAALTGYFGTLR